MEMATQKYSVMKMPALLCENLGVKLGHRHKVPSKLLDVQMVCGSLKYRHDVSCQKSPLYCGFSMIGHLNV